MALTLLVFARCAGFVFRAPGFSHPSVPPPVRAGFALLLAVEIVRGLPAGARLPDGASAFTAALVLEFLIGITLGLSAALLYDAAYSGGRIVDDYVGVKAIAPSTALVAPSGFGRVWSLVFTGAFFLTGAYRPTLASFAGSFERLPPAMPLPLQAWGAFAGAFAAQFVVAALQIAAPAVGLAFVVQIALGAVSRAVPRFGSFTLAFPLAFAAALAATVAGAPLAVRSVP